MPAPIEHLPATRWLLQKAIGRVFKSEMQAWVLHAFLSPARYIWPASLASDTDRNAAIRWTARGRHRPTTHKSMQDREPILLQGCAGKKPVISQGEGHPVLRIHSRVMPAQLLLTPLENSLK